MMDGTITLSELIFRWLFETTLCVGVLYLVLRLAFWAFKRQINPKWQYIMLSIVFVRLFVPVLFETRWNPVSFDMTSPKDGAITVEQNNSHIAAQNNSRTNSVPTESDASNSIGNSVLQIKDPETPVTESRVVSSAHAFENESRLSSLSAAINPYHLTVTVWLTGVLAVILFQLHRYRRFTQALITPTLSERKRLNHAMMRAKKSMGIQISPKLLVTDKFKTAYLFGLFRPSIVFSRHLLSTLEDHEISLVMQHELTHIRHKDHWVNWLSLFAGAIHWFNPLAWIIVKQFGEIRELYCDQVLLVKCSVDQKSDYGHTLLKLIVLAQGPGTAVNVAAFAKRYFLLKRIKTIMESNEMKKSLKFICAAVVTITLFAGFTRQCTTATASNTKPVPPKVTKVSTDDEYVDSIGSKPSNKNEMDGVWFTELEPALAQAKKQNKRVLLYVTDTVYCDPCKALEAEVFSRPVFQTEVKSMGLILVKLDEKGKRIPPERLAYIERMSDVYDVKGYPTFIVLNSNGQPLEDFRYVQVLDSDAPHKVLQQKLKASPASDDSAAEAYAKKKEQKKGDWYNKVEAWHDARTRAQKSGKLKNVFRSWDKAFEEAKRRDVPVIVKVCHPGAGVHYPFDQKIFLQDRWLDFAADNVVILEVWEYLGQKAEYHTRTEFLKGEDDLHKQNMEKARGTIGPFTMPSAHLFSADAEYIKKFSVERSEYAKGADMLIDLVKSYKENPMTPPPGHKAKVEKYKQELLQQTKSNRVRMDEWYETRMSLEKQGKLKNVYRSWDAAFKEAKARKVPVVVKICRTSTTVCEMDRNIFHTEDWLEFSAGNAVVLEAWDYLGLNAKFYVRNEFLKGEEKLHEKNIETFQKHISGEGYFSPSIHIFNAEAKHQVEMDWKDVGDANRLIGIVKHVQSQPPFSKETAAPAAGDQSLAKKKQIGNSLRDKIEIWSADRTRIEEQGKSKNVYRSWDDAFKEAKRRNIPVIVKLLSPFSPRTYELEQNVFLHEDWLASAPDKVVILEIWKHSDKVDSLNRNLNQEFAFLKAEDEQHRQNIKTLEKRIGRECGGPNVQPAFYFFSAGGEFIKEGDILIFRPAGLIGQMMTL